MIEEVFAGREKLGQEEFNKIIEDISSEMFLSVSNLFFVTFDRFSCFSNNRSLAVRTFTDIKRTMRSSRLLTEVQALADPHRK